ncbi:4-hydroxythreonine-4-phosphate dehydrogenase PdxA [bacterium]|nr:4-hydroxythreonine-4-phosphate dehydrogenase PdxA [bacterium]NIO73371.1 4-hydroxythreonine-4-phosphate dehydrogenase PdxA [bacterium]
MMGAKIVITMGDSAGVGPEIIVKALSLPETYKICQPVVVGDVGVLESVLESAKGAWSKEKLRLNPIKDIRKARFNFGVIDLFDLDNIDMDRLKLGKVDSMCGKATLEYIKKGIEIINSGGAKTMVTAPLCKKSIEDAGFSYPGHTELLAELTGTKDFAMMLVGGNLRVVLVTRHLPLKDVASSLSKEKVLLAVRLGVEAMKALGIDSPRVGVCALNPHAGEWGILGKEEIETVIPAIEEAKKEGINISGPLPGDKAFYDTAGGRYDLAIAMYHDQGQVPVKLLSYTKSVNVTLGLPFVRTSPCHGTGFDIAGQSKANPQSFMEAIKLATKLIGKKG